MEYSKFKVEEFVTDEYFVRWIKKPDVETNAFWNSWLSKNLQQLASVRIAREIILQLDFKTRRGFIIVALALVVSTLCSRAQQTPPFRNACSRSG